MRGCQRIWCRRGREANAALRGGVEKRGGRRRMKQFLFCFAYTLQAFRFAEFIALAELNGVEVLYNKEDVVELDSTDDEKGV